MPKDPSKTEEATPKRIRDARKDGNVLFSPEVGNVSMMFIGALLLILVGSQTTASFNSFFQLFKEFNFTGQWEIGDIARGVNLAALELIKILLLPMLLLAIIGAASSIAQVGFYFETKPLELKADRLKPDFKKVLPNKENITKLAMALVKVLIIAFIVYSTLKGSLSEIRGLQSMPIESALSWILGKAMLLIYRVLTVFIIVAAVDYVLKRRKYYEDLKMSKQEVKDENKDVEGDPLVKSQMRRRMRELTMNALINAVPEADVIVVNPTHVAVALKYSRGDVAPKIVAKGLRKRALRIREIASKSKIPIVREAPLARSLYRNCKVGQFIPGEFFKAVAVILARLQREGIRQF